LSCAIWAAGAIGAVVTAQAGGKNHDIAVHLGIQKLRRLLYGGHQLVVELQQHRTCVVRENLLQVRVLFGKQLLQPRLVCRQGQLRQHLRILLLPIVPVCGILNHGRSGQLRHTLQGLGKLVDLLHGLVETSRQTRELLDGKLVVQAPQALLDRLQLRGDLRRGGAERFQRLRRGFEAAEQ